VVALPVVATITAAVFLGTTRTRVAAEPAIALFAATGLVLAIQRWLSLPRSNRTESDEQPGIDLRNEAPRPVQA